jgi:ribonucleoside-diphosphate reductase alpha chain
MQKGKKFLSDLKLYSDYFKWREDLGRYENWDEACESIISTHVNKYGDKILPYSNLALSSMKEKAVLASQRTLQYRGTQLEKHNTRLYNCTSTYMARNRAFQEIFYLMLSGCGVGVGLLKPFIANLSKIQKRTLGTKTFIIPDSIEGWSDALGVLMSSYFVDDQPFPEYAGYEIKFDYSLIRQKGAFISGGFKAPGPKGLRNSINRIEELINNWIATEKTTEQGTPMRAILVFDILCHVSNAVLSGGVRRAAMNMIVDPYDNEMINAKIGDWYNTHPHRARSNNSVILLRNNTTQDRFTEIVKMNDGISDIGFVFANSWFDMFNPCFEISKVPMLFSGDLDKIKYDEVEDFIREHKDLLGVQGCNLTEINAERCTTKDKFLNACKSASILGTFQAGFSSFPYLGETTEKIFQREALLGVSITGWMNNPKLFNAQLLQEGAEMVKSTNKEVAALIGINQAARTTCVKPSGNACTAFDTKIKTNKGDMTLNEIFNVSLLKDIDPNKLVGKTFATPLIPISVYNENNELEPITHIYVNPVDKFFKK